MPTYPFTVYEILGKKQNKSDSIKTSYELSAIRGGSGLKERDRLISINGAEIKEKSAILRPLIKAMPGTPMTLKVERDTIIRFFSVSLSPNVVVTPDSVTTTTFQVVNTKFEKKLGTVHALLLILLIAITAASVYLLNHRGQNIFKHQPEKAWLILLLFSLPAILQISAHFSGDSTQAALYRISLFLLLPILTLFLLNRFETLWNMQRRRFGERFEVAMWKRLLRDFPGEKSEKNLTAFFILGAALFTLFEILTAFGDLKTVVSTAKQWMFPIWQFGWALILILVMIAAVRAVNSNQLRPGERDGIARKS